MMTPTAPRFCASWIFVPNVQTPRSINAILPVRSSEIAGQPFAGVVVAVAAVIAGLQFANSPTAAPLVVVSKLALMPSKGGSAAAAAGYALAGWPGYSTRRIPGP